MILSAIVFAIGFLLALFITAKKSGIIMKDCLLIVGIVSTIFGFMLMMQGNSSGIDLSGAGQLNSQYKAGFNIGVTKCEREKTNYFKNFKNHSVVNPNLISTAIAIGGIAMIICDSLLS